MSKSSMLEEMVETARVQFVERLSSPLIGSFVIEWCLWNFKFFVVLFSKESVVETFRLIDTVVFPTAESVLRNGVVYPLLSACAYIFLYPIPARFVYSYSRKQAKVTDELRKKQDGEKLITENERTELREQVVEREAVHKKVVRDLHLQIVELQRLNSELADYAGVARDDIRFIGNGPSGVFEETRTEPDASQLTKPMWEVLELFRGSNAVRSEDELFGLISEDQNKVRHRLSEMVRLKVLSIGKRPDGLVVYVATREGRELFKRRINQSDPS